MVIAGWLGVEETPPATAYDPLALPDSLAIETLDLTVIDPSRDREIPLRIYLPASDGPGPVVLFSHGLGGSCQNNPYLGEHWAGRGYGAVFVQHPGSDQAIWQDVPRRQRLSAMKKSASAQNFMLRVKDIPTVLDQLERWNQEKAHPLHQRLNLERLGMSGHSFGALTTQAVSGQTYRGKPLFLEPRIKAALALSPSCPPKEKQPEQAFGRVKIPWLLMTGTLDVSLIGEADLESRLAVFSALPPGGKYELVLFEAEHSAFSERAGPGDSEKRNPNHHRVVLALSTAFWDAYLRADPAARAWLDGEGAKSVLEKEDRWRRK